MTNKRIASFLLLFFGGWFILALAAQKIGNDALDYVRRRDKQSDELRRYYAALPTTKPSTQPAECK